MNFILIMILAITIGCGRGTESHDHGTQRRVQDELHIFRERHDAVITAPDTALAASNKVFQKIDFIGMKRAEVIEILGPPDGGYLDQEGRLVGNPFRYFIGGNPMRPALVYELHFDNDRVAKIDTGWASS